MTSPVAAARTRPPAARAPRVGAKAGTPDQLAIALPNDEASRLWADKQFGAIAAARPAALAAIVAEGEAWLRKPNLDARSRARVHLVISGAAGQLASLGESQMANGKAAYRHVAAAFAADPTYQDAAVSFGRTLAAFCDLSWGKRKLVEVGLGISVAGEARRLGVALGAFERDAIAQLTRRKLGAFAGDDKTVAAADAALATLPAARVAAARRELGVDAGYAAKAKQ